MSFCDTVRPEPNRSYNMIDRQSFIIAAIQSSPVYLDPDAACEKACRLIGESARKDARIAAFSGSWLPGYPGFVWANQPASEESVTAGSAYLESAVEIPSEITQRLCESAGDNNIDVVIGVAERDKRTRATVYCTLLFIESNGQILGRHRKLKPTRAERLAWGNGDASGLRVYQRDYARIGGLNCWEHTMMLPGYSLAAQGIQIHIAAWPDTSSLADSGAEGLLLTRAFAVQAGTYAVAVGAVRGSYEGSKSLLTRGSCIIEPSGKIVAEASPTNEEIVVAEGSVDSINETSLWRDIVGHYSRPDIFQLQINRWSANESSFSE